MKRTIAAAAIALAAAAGPAGAAEFDFGVKAGVGHSDNIRRVPAAEESETILTAGLDLAFLREEGRLHADVSVDLTYFDYQDNTYDGEVTGIANADLRFLFVPGRFEWMLADSFGQSQIDPFAAVTPDNRENVNYFTTGPDLTIRLGSAANLVLFGRWSASQFEESNFDDERLLAGLSLGRSLSQRSSVSLNVTSETVEFDDPAFGRDFERRSAFLRYEIEGARTRLGAEAGYTEVEFDTPLPFAVNSTSSPLFEIDLERELSERSTLTLLAGVRSSDASTALRGGAPPGLSPGLISTSDPFETRQVTLSWQFQAQRTDFMLSAGWEEDVYETLGLLDRERQVFSASANRRLTPRLTLRAEASLFSSDFSSASQEDDETQYGLSLSWNAAGRLWIELEAQHFNRDSTNAASEFDETRAFLRFAWRRSSNTGG